MEGLYKRVIVGVYPHIPNRYSEELGKTIKWMLQVNPKKRPTAEDLLNSNTILNKVEELFGSTLADTKSILLNTIRFTNNQMKLSSKLPEPKYKTQERDEVQIKDVKSEVLLPDLFDSSILSKSNKKEV